MTLQLLIATLDDRIKSIPDLLLEPLPDVSYLVSWQQSEGYEPCPVPAALKRDDVKLATMQGVGLSRNRNNCLDLATGDICLIADDDCRYTASGLQEIVKQFQSHPDVAVATFKARNEEACKRYPDVSFDLSKPARKYYVTSCEIAVRREAVAGKVKFNERFGLGSGVFDCGEESIFIHDALQAGLKCTFFPIEVVEQLGATTDTTHAAEPRVLMARGAIMYKTHSHCMLFRAIAVAWRLRRNKGIPFNYALEHTIKGYSLMQALEEEE